MNREEALNLVNQRLTNKNLIKHSLAVEAVMKALAKFFNEDGNIWGLAGLLHDLDYEQTAETPDKHGITTEEWLKEFNLDPQIIQIIKAHNAEALEIEPQTKAEISIYAADPVTGLITATALMNPEKKIKNVNLKSVTKKFKNLKFAAGANRENIKTIEKTGLSLEKFLELALIAMQGIDQELGL